MTIHQSLTTVGWAARSREGEGRRDEFCTTVRTTCTPA